MLSPVIYALQTALVIIPLVLGLYLGFTSYDDLREDHPWFMDLLRCRRNKIVRVRIIALLLVTASFVWAFFWAKSVFPIFQ